VQQTKDWFRREIVYTNLTRAIRYTIVLLVIDGGLLIVDLVRLIRGQLATHHGYYLLFISHVILLGVLLAYLVVHYLTRPKSTDQVTPGHTAVTISFAAVFLVYCTFASMIDQSIHGQITIYVIGCMTLAVGIYLPSQVSVPLYTLNHALFLGSMYLLQPDRETLTSHFINGTIVMGLAVIIARLMFDARRRVFQGMSIIHQQQSKLERLAIEDSLTGLYNRRYADARLLEELERSQRYDRPFSIAMADIDHFKRVNDDWSHQVGDEVLRQLAGLMRAAIRAVDVVARYGGEEFVVLFPETEESSARSVCEKMRSSVERHNWHVIRDGLAVTISIGVAGSDTGEDVQTILRVADERLYRAKHAGRNLVVAGD
jgi:diguanylate cyclase (GGDEF)-like protein